MRERIKINDKPISEADFTRYFFDIWDRLGSAVPLSPQFASLPPRPGYFRFLTLVALHAYMSEDVDTAIIECGIGGEYDSTNIIVHPSVTGITTLGIDHTMMLGDTLESIAWHKAGIMKRGAACWSAPQAASAEQVLRDRADELGAELKVVPTQPDTLHAKLGLSGEFQVTNAGVAVALARTHIERLCRERGMHEPATKLDGAIKLGLEKVVFPGRCDVRKDHKAPIIYHLDCAHTLDSIDLACRWFKGTAHQQQAPRILLFNQATRSPEPLLKLIFDSSKDEPFTHVIFCTNRTYSNEGTVPELTNHQTYTRDQDSLDLQQRMKLFWQSLGPGLSKQSTANEPVAMKLADQSR